MMNAAETPSTDVLTLTQQLISIPSYVDTHHDESMLVDFIERFFAAHVPSLTVEKQAIVPGSHRSNLIIRGNGATDIFVLGHIDTVQPTENWKTNPLKPTIIKDMLYGLGAADMKGSLAAFLCALAAANPSDLINLTVLLYADEEYGFQGTKRFLQDNPFSERPPRLIVSLDGSPELASGCRGLIEFDARVVGKSGHASNPANGANVITGVVRAVNELEGRIKDYADAYLGVSTLNLAYMRAGVTERQGDETVWLREGNVIPDSADITLEIRTADMALNSKIAIELFERYTQEAGLSIGSLKLRHDYGPWAVSYDSPIVSWLEDCYKRAELDFVLSDRTYSGFIDVQMVTEVVDAPTFVIGAGGYNKHGADEHVEIENLTKIEKLYSIVLNKYGDLTP